MLKLLCTNTPVRVLPGMAYLFSYHHLTETVSIQQLASLCGCGINIVSSLGSLGHAKVVKVITYLCGCQLDWSQTICFLCISTQLLWLIGWAIVISSGGQRQPMADCRQISKLLPHVSHFSLYSKLYRHDVDMDLVTSMCMWVPSGLHQSVHYACIMY